MKLLSSAAVRRIIVADPGYAIISADFDQVEWRILAALAGEQSMIAAIKRGESIHKYAATRLFGPDYTPDEYGRTKNINFTFAFGGGASKIASTYDIPYPEAQKLIADYTKEFPALVRYKRKQQEKVLKSALSSTEYRMVRSLQSRMFALKSNTSQGQKARALVKAQINRICYGKVGYITTPFGRRLPVDAVKPYSVVNYMVQPTAADLMKMALLDVMAEPELEPTVLLPIHDEILGQAPIDRAEYIVKRYAEVMTRKFMGVPITASGEVYGKSWGHGYLRK